MRYLLSQLMLMRSVVVLVSIYNVLKCYVFLVVTYSRFPSLVGGGLL